MIGIFGAANESVYYTAFAVKSFRIYLCMMVLATVNKGTFIFLQSLGKAVESTVISLTREIVFGVALPILFPLFWGLDGLLYSFPAADILTFLIAAVVIRRTYRELSAGGPERPRRRAPRPQPDGGDRPAGHADYVPSRYPSFVVLFTV